MVSSPDGTTNTLQFVEVHGATQVTNLFTYSGVSNQWRFDQGNGLNTMLMKEGWDANHTNRTETVQRIDPATGNLLRQKVSQFQIIPTDRYSTAASIGREVLVSEVYGYGGVFSTNLYSYDNLGRLSQSVMDGGATNQYTYDGSGRLATATYPLGDALQTGNTHQTTYDYTPLTQYGDDITHFPNTARSVLDSSISSITYFIASNNATLQMKESASSPFSGSYLCTTNWYYTSGPSAAQLQRVDHPDGTMDLYVYGANSTNRTNIVYSGQANSDRSAVINGIETITVYNSLGQVQTKRVLDIASQIVTSQQIYTAFDIQGRPGFVTFLDGTTITNSYDCCNLSSTTDRDGVVTSYTYDNLKRRTSETRHIGGSGITTTYIYNAVGDLLSTTITGTNGTSSYTVSSQSYDPLGRPVLETNALMGVTTNLYGYDSVGRPSITNLYPYGGMQITLYSADGSIYKTYGSAVHGVKNLTDGINATETKLNADGSETQEWEVRSIDSLGRPNQTKYADNNYSSIVYNSLGQMVEQVDADGNKTLYAYNGMGSQDTVVQYCSSSPNDDTIHYDGGDHITKTINDVFYDSNLVCNVQRSRTYVWSTNGSAVSNLISTVETSTDGLRSWQISWNNGMGITNRSVTSYASGGWRIEYRYAPDGSFSAVTNRYGLPISSTRYDASTNTISQVSYSYDAFGRVQGSTDLRNGTTSYGYNNAGLVTATTNPPATALGTQLTTYTYYNQLMQPTNVVN